MTVRFGLVGYGVGGRLFHAPYIDASARCELAGILVRNADRVAAARADLPGVTVYKSIDEMVADGVEAVTISTPPETRRELVVTAMEAGLHVIADKPFAPTANDAAELVHVAECSARLLNVYHNRRWDTDIVTAREVIRQDELGSISRLDLRCDQDDPFTLEGGPTGGLLRDLGSHVVDQALNLLGPAAVVYAKLDCAPTPRGDTDVAFALDVTHTSGAHSHISSCKLNRLDSRELRLLGARGSYVSDYSDVQYRAILAGRRPKTDKEWGLEKSERWGVLRTTDGRDRIVPSLRGDYTELYTRFAEAIEEGGSGPVPATEGVAVLTVLDAARESATTGQAVHIRGA